MWMNILTLYHSFPPLFIVFICELVLLFSCAFFTVSARHITPTRARQSLWTTHYTSIGIGSIYLYIHKYGLHDDPVGFTILLMLLLHICYWPGRFMLLWTIFEGDSDRFFTYLLDTIASTIYLYYGRSEDFFHKYCLRSFW